eukprot:197296-Alexandrium_andersonii.AAC.1
MEGLGSAQNPARRRCGGPAGGRGTARAHTSSRTIVQMRRVQGKEQYSAGPGDRPIAANMEYTIAKSEGLPVAKMARQARVKPTHPTNRMRAPMPT